MSYKVTSPLVIIPNVDGVSGDWYGYAGATVPDGLNPERCKQLAMEGMLESGASSSDSDGGSSKPAGVKDILKDVGDDPVKAQAALDAENERGDDARQTLVSGLEAVIAKGQQS